MRSTLELLGELAEQTCSLVQIEVSLVSAELRERSATIPSNLTKVGVGVVFLPIGLTLILVALGLALRRFGIPADLAFLIIALLVIAGGLIRADLRFQGAEIGPAHSCQEHRADLVVIGRASGWR